MHAVFPNTATEINPRRRAGSIYAPGNLYHLDLEFSRNLSEGADGLPDVLYQ